MAGVSLLTGLNAGLLRLGVWAPVASDRIADLHGPVMVLGFMGTLISLERAQALRNPLAYLAPGLLGVGSLALLSGAPVALGKLLLLDGTVAFVVLALALWRRAPLGLVAAQALAATFAALAAALWLVAEIPAVIPLLAAFLIITIASERAELAQLTMGRRAVPTLLSLGSLIGASSALALVVPAVGSRLLGVGCLLTAAWLLRDDVGRRMVRTSGLRRFNAAALLGGNAWLAVAGAVWLIVGQPTSTGTYDAVVHGVFLGFGMSMIMAHAPIIFPAVIGRPLPYRPVMWIPLGLLNLGMLVRVVGGLSQITPLHQLGGSLTVAAVLLFAVTVIISVVKG
ncbi:hypothetical protein BW733_11455 [Tessaracoccus flavescens]|uniref:NnrS family protein n=1 Tax=Tessaracoccus flavescens TaxID=399497 RepID=A0A1Q2D2J2_9ACTN|nr:hypothetical protein BW733_11455 [Tessaracoccus flavescens]